MLVQHLLVWSALHAAKVLAQSLQSVLLDNGLTGFAGILAGHPVHSSGFDLIVYAPTDAALEQIGGAAVARRADISASLYLSGGTSPTFSKPKNSSSTTSTTSKATPTSTAKLRLARAEEAPCGVARETWLDDPAFVNLGPRHNQTIIEKNVCGMARPLVFTGLGASVKVTADDIPFDRGVVRPISGVFTMPRTLSETLRILGASSFLDALRTTGLLAELDSRPAITVLAPSDAVFRRETAGFSDAQIAQVLRGHVLVDFPAYSPLVQSGDVYPTLAGSRVTASVVDDDAISFDGVVVSASDAIIENGVVHTIDKVLTGSLSATPSSTTGPSSTASQTAVVTAGAAMGTTPGWGAMAFTIFAVLAAAARHYLG